MPGPDVWQLLLGHTAGVLNNNLMVTFYKTPIIGKAALFTDFCYL